MTRTEQRQLALGAARSLLRKQGRNVFTASVLDAHQVLDDFACQYPACMVSCWYRTASEFELALFYRDWDVWQQKQHWLLPNPLEARHR
jgi:hypothetical protein